MKNLPKKISTETDSQTVNGGIGDGVNDGGPAYCIDTVEDSEDE